MSNSLKFVTDFSKGILGEPDSPDLWNSILDKIPNEVLLKPDVKILNVAFGYGTEADLLAQRMIELGVDKEAVKKSIHLIDKFQTFTNRAHRKGYTNIITADFLEWDCKEQFDVIIGGPPFQAPNDGDYSFWARFVDKSHKLLADGGYLSMIIPAGWMSPTKDIRQGKRSVMRDIFAKADTFYINIDPDLGRKYFNGIGQKFTWFCLRKGNYSSTYVDLGDTGINVDIQGMPMLAKETDNINIGIIKKLSAKKTKWEFVRSIMQEKWSEVKFEPSANYPYPRINGNTNKLNDTVYASTICKFQAKKKVVLPYNGTKFLFVVDNGSQGVTNSYTLILEENELVDSARVYFGSPVIKWLGKNKFTQYNEGSLINSVSKMDLTKPITEQDVYQFYGLSADEIAYINS
jgi:hypothetical protein